MIQYVTTSIFGSNADALVVPVNTDGVMGKGLALAFAQRYPALEREYALRCAQDRLTIGSIFVYRIPITPLGQPHCVVCLPTKKHWRHPAQSAYVETGLQVFAQHYSAFDIASIAFPQLGCGLGGLDWNHVRPLMERYLAPLPIRITIHLRVN